MQRDAGQGLGIPVVEADPLGRDPADQGDDVFDVNRRSIAGTRSGGLRETQEMIDFCAAHGIGAEVEVIDADGIDAAFRRLLAGDVRFRLVIDIRRLGEG